MHLFSIFALYGVYYQSSNKACGELKRYVVANNKQS